MYFPDLSPYTYFTAHGNGEVYNVGWLDDRHGYPTGSVDEEVLDILFRLCTEERRNQTRGFHRCQLCSRADEYPTRVVRGEREALLGSAEIRVSGSDGIAYAAPDMIYHYIVDHGYLPPREFLDALLSYHAAARPSTIHRFLRAVLRKK